MLKHRVAAHHGSGHSLSNLSQRREVRASIFFANKMTEREKKHHNSMLEDPLAGKPGTSVMGAILTKSWLPLDQNTMAWPGRTNLGMWQGQMIVTSAGWWMDQGRLNDKRPGAVTSVTRPYIYTDFYIPLSIERKHSGSKIVPDGLLAWIAGNARTCFLFDSLFPIFKHL